MSLLVKICGLKTEESVAVAIEAGVDMIGLNFHPRSPRYVSLERATELAAFIRGKADIVALSVDPEDGLLAQIHSAARPDLWQLHGKERFERVRDIRSLFDRPVMKAVGVESAADLALVQGYACVADHVLLDAKPPKDAAYPGGHGQPFDWSVLSALPLELPFMLSGGLTPENVGSAIRTMRTMRLNLIGVDVASGVESAPGVKDLGKIKAFIAEVRNQDRREAEGVQ